MKTKRHKHFWSYLHTAFSTNDKPNDVSVVRYCDVCKTIQSAHATKWSKTKSPEWDMRMLRRDCFNPSAGDV